MKVLFVSKVTQHETVRQAYMKRKTQTTPKAPEIPWIRSTLSPV